MDKKYFSNPGDIENNFFKVPGDIESVSKGDTISTDNVEDYLVSVVSGKKYDSECELGTLVGAGG